MEMEVGAQLTALRQWLENPCFEYFLGEGDDSPNLIKTGINLVFGATPTTLETFLLREQALGEIRAVRDVREKVKAHIAELTLETDKTKQEEHERRNTVSDII